MAWVELREKHKKRLYEMLARIGALKFGTFTLTSGKLSSYYLDLRIVPSFPDAYSAVCSALVDIVRHDVGADSFERISGIPTAGVPFASVIAYELKKPFLYVRKEARTHGRGRHVEGILNPGDRVLLVDDLITTGGSLLQAADSIRAEGGVVNDAAVLVDRSEGGGRILVKSGISPHFLVDIREVAEYMLSSGFIDDEQYKSVLRQTRK